MSVVSMDQWVLDLFRAVDAMDAATLAKAFTEDGTFRFGNNPPAVGREQIEQNASGFFAMIGGLSHEITGVWSGTWAGGDVKSVEAEVTYTRQDGTRTQPVPCVSTMRLEGDQIKDYRIFIDVAPVFAP
jgi:ketosteroid isomerase-like protein